MAWLPLAPTQTNHRWSSTAGQLLIELLIAVGFFAILAPALLTGFTATTQGLIQEEKRRDASTTLLETTEAVRNIREEDWSAIENDGVFHVLESDTNWQLASGSATTSGLTQTVTISSVLRDSTTGTISATGDFADLSTKQVDVELSWQDPVPGSLTQTSFLTRLKNISQVFTSVADFEAAGHVLSDAVIKDDAGGEIKGESTVGTGAGFCNPTTVETVDLQGTADAHGLVGAEGNIYVATGRDDTGNPLTHVTVSDEIPPVAQVEGIFSSSHRSNAAYGDGGQYAMIATDTNDKEVVIVNLDTMTETGWYDASGSRDGTAVVFQDNVGFMTTDHGYLYSFDVSDFSGSRPTLDSLSLGNSATNLFVRGNYLYVTLNISWFQPQMKIIDISNPNNLQTVSSVRVSGAFGRDVFVNEAEDRAYLVTSWLPFFRELFIIDISDKSDPDYVSSYSTAWMSPEGITVGTNDTVALIGGLGAIEYQVVDISVETAPTLCGWTNIDTGVFDVFAIKESDGDHYGYLATGDSDKELVIVEGGSGLDTGPGGGGGFYESPIIDVGRTAAFNRFEASTIEPGTSDVYYQISVVDAVEGDCGLAGSAFVGPDGSSTTFFEENVGLIPFNSDDSGFENPGQCFRYRVLFDAEEDTDFAELLDFTINYSP